MGKTSQTTDLTGGQNMQGTANSRDLNFGNANAFYNYLTGGQGEAPTGGTAAGQGSAISQGLGAEAKRQADAAFSPFGQAMGEYAADQSRTQRRAVETRLAQGGALGAASGAAQGAIARAVASPYAAANAAMQQQYGNLYQGAHNNLSQGLAGASQQAIVAPQYQTQKTDFGNFLDLGLQLGSSFMGRH